MSFIFDQSWPPTPDQWARLVALVEQLTNLRTGPGLKMDWPDAGPAVTTQRKEGFFAQVTAVGTNGSISWTRLDFVDKGLRVPPHLPASGVGEGASPGTDPQNPGYPAAAGQSASAGDTVWMEPGAIGTGGQQYVYVMVGAGSCQRVLVDVAVACSAGVITTTKTVKYIRGVFTVSDTPC